MNNEIGFDYRKLPAWWRNAKYSEHEKLCKRGKHVPVRMDWHNGKKEYACQNCGEPMTEKQWKEFFKDAKNEK